jgi:hypothetical protein
MITIIYFGNLTGGTLVVSLMNAFHSNGKMQYYHFFSVRCQNPKGLCFSAVQVPAIISQSSSTPVMPSAEILRARNPKSEEIAFTPSLTVVCCDCNYTFCWLCVAEAHDPASCQSVQR